jgi:hypothetical protein
MATAQCEPESASISSQQPRRASSASGLRRSITPSLISRPLEPVVVGLTFIERVGTKRLNKDTLDAWVEQNLVAPGYVSRALRIIEPIFGALPTDKGCSLFLPESPPTDETTAILVRARARVVGHLRGLLRSQVDDRFLNTAIFAGRVRRASAGQTTHWIPSPRDNDALSDIITSLFVSDILGRREFYVENLCICTLCGRVRLDAAVATERDRCFFC